MSWGEHYLRNRDGSERGYWPHQAEDLLAPEKNIIHLDGRGVGKTISLSTDALHFAFTTMGGQGLIAAPQQGHLDTVVEEIEFQLDANPLLMRSLAVTQYGKPKIHRKPYFRLEFANGAVLYFRPAGPYGDAFRSLHVDRIWVDEGAWLSERAWKALRQCLNANGTLRIYSTPNGLRIRRITGSHRRRSSGVPLAVDHPELDCGARVGTVESRGRIPRAGNTRSRANMASLAMGRSTSSSSG